LVVKKCIEKEGKNVKEKPETERRWLGFGHVVQNKWGVGAGNEVVVPVGAPV
jgi:hypothetical protein